MRLIDADAVMNRLNDATGGLEEEFPTDEQVKPFMCGVRLATCFIGITPTIDAVPVVRCKNCKHRYITGSTTHYYVCDFMDAEYNDNGYCHHGEREDDE